MQDVRDYKWLLLSALLWGAGFLYLFMAHFGPLEGRWSAEDSSYCYLIPPLFAYLVWQVRFKLCALSCGNPLAGYLLMLLAGCVYVVGLLGALETLIYGAMWLAVIGGCALLFGGGALQKLAFAFVVLAFAVPLPPFIIRLMTFRLKLLSSALAVRMLEWLSIPAFGEGNVIDMGVTKLQIVDACSGLRYLLPSILLALLIGYFFHTRLWKRLVLLVLAAPVTLVSNAFRIAMTGVLVQYVSPEFGEGFLHDFSGWVVYMLSILLLGGCSLGLKRISPAPQAREEEATVCPVPSGQEKLWPHALVCGLLLVCVGLAGDSMLQRQFTPQRDSFDHFSMQLGDWTGKRLFLSEAVLAELWADDYVTGNFKNRKTGNVLHVLVSYYKRQTATHTAHAPTSCLVGSGWFLENKEVLAPDAAAGRSFPVTRMVLQQAGTRVISNFWFQQRGRHIVDEYKNKMWLVWDSLTRGRSDGALVRLELFLKDGQTVHEGQALLDEFAGLLRGRLNPYVPGAGK